MIFARVMLYISDSFFRISCQTYAPSLARSIDKPDKIKSLSNRIVKLFVGETDSVCVECL